MIRLSTASSGFETGFTALLNQARETTETVDKTVATIIADIRSRGDAALIDYTARFDRLTLTADRLRISAAEIDAARGIDPRLDDGGIGPGRLSDRGIPSSSAARRSEDDDEAGMTLGMRWTSLDSVGLYVPEARQPTRPRY